MKDKIVQKKSFKNLIARYFVLFIAISISSLQYNLFVVPINLVLGGTGGLGIIFKDLFYLEPSTTIFVISIFLIIFSFIFLDKNDTYAALFIAVFYPFLIKKLSFVTDILYLETSSKFLLCLCAGFFTGVSNGLIYKVGLNTGGLGILYKIIHKEFNISITLVSLLINGMIVVMGGFLFGFNMVMYAIVTLYISRIISENILIGNKINKMFYIVSDKYEDIKDYIMNELGHDVTIFNIKGMYDKKSGKALMSVVSTSKYEKLKEKIMEIDKNAFVVVSESYEAFHQDRKLNAKRNKKDGPISRILSNNMI